MGNTETIDIPIASSNPFAALSLIAAPAVLTNACSVLVLSTSNRLGRSVDRSRELGKQLDKERELSEEESKAERMLLKELDTVQNRTVILMTALRLFYTALGGFASAAVVSVIGALLVVYGTGILVYVIESIAAMAGMVAVGSLIYGCFLLVKETRLAVGVLKEQADDIHRRVATRLEKYANDPTKHS